MKERMMVKVSRSENCNCIIFKVVSTRKRDFDPSHRFYVNSEELDKLLETEIGYIISKDIRSFAEFSVLTDKLKITFTWLESNGLGDLRGVQQRVYLDYGLFKDWYYSEIPEQSFLSKSPKSSSSKIHFHSSKNLKQVLENPVVRKKFRKAIMKLTCWNDVEVMDDFVDYSFFWRERLLDGGFGICGGLIFHKDYEEPDNLAKGYFATHT